MEHITIKIDPFVFLNDEDYNNSYLNITIPCVRCGKKLKYTNTDDAIRGFKKEGWKLDKERECLCSECVDEIQAEAEKENRLHTRDINRTISENIREGK